jgi:hypothetical protein
VSEYSTRARAIASPGLDTKVSECTDVTAQDPSSVWSRTIIHQSSNSPESELDVTISPGIPHTFLYKICPIGSLSVKSSVAAHDLPSYRVNGVLSPVVAWTDAIAV